MNTNWRQEILDRDSRDTVRVEIVRRNEVNRVDIFGYDVDDLPVFWSYVQREQGVSGAMARARRQFDYYGLTLGDWHSDDLGDVIRAEVVA